MALSGHHFAQADTVIFRPRRKRNRKCKKKGDARIKARGKMMHGSKQEERLCMDQSKRKDDARIKARGKIMQGSKKGER